VKTIVSNAGPIISAARAGQLDILHSVVQQLILPPAVHDEIVLKGAGKPGAEPEALSAWTEVRSLTHPETVLSLPAKLGAGEREAIVLAEELGAALLIDDPAARAEAGRRGLAVFGTLGVLKQAKAMGLIQEVKPVLEEYRTSGFRIRDDLYEQFLRELGEL
jgi:predicted nucleic acid-binding protein